MTVRRRELGPVIAYELAAPYTPSALPDLLRRLAELIEDTKNDDLLSVNLEFDVEATEQVLVAVFDNGPHHP